MKIRYVTKSCLLVMVVCLFGLTGEAFSQEQNIVESFGLYSKGVEYYYGGKLHEAKEVLEKAIEFDPRNYEARTYLDLVNAELKMRARGYLDFGDTGKELIRESDFGEYRTKKKEKFAEEDRYKESEYTGTYQEEYLEPHLRIDKGKKSYSYDKIKAVSEEINDNIYPAKIQGEYKMSLGLTTADLIWKDANGDYNERNFRMIDNNFPKTDTFDTRVYDRFKVVFDTNKDGEGLNFHSDITVDPWSFVGKTGRFTVTSDNGDDRVEMDLKYWAGTGRTINEIFHTLDLGDSLATQEYKVVDGKIPSFTIASSWSNFTVPEQEIDFSFQPVRELWFDLNNGDSKMRIFPFALEDQAFSSDDPLGISNHHIYWEPSPWLDDWIPGHVNQGATPDDFWRGEWSDDLSFFTRDSDLKRLTALRGISFQEKLLDDVDLSFTIASPKGLWQDYDSLTALPGAIRTKTRLNDKLMIGALDTFRIGYKDGKTDSYNNVFGVDFSYDILADANIVGEIAMSKSEDDRTSSYATDKNGTAAHLGFKQKSGLGDMKIAFTHMDEAFDAGLANYTETRQDQFWGRHIHFKEPLEYLSGESVPLKYEDIEPFRIGDGIDTGRNAFNFRVHTKDAFEGRMDNLIDYRYVRDSEHKYVEGVVREENTVSLSPEWTSKLLLIYHNLPKTKAGIDPIQYDSDTGDFLKNAAIEDGKDPSLYTASLGIGYEPEDWITVFGIYERTNDFRFSTGNHPNGLLNSSYFSTETIDGEQFRNEVPQLYSQGFFDLPPYDGFNIYRTGISLKPSDRLGIDFDYTKNDFKFAAGIDDNMNHFGTTLRYEFNAKLTGFLKYTFSKLYNLYRLNTSGDLDYEEHHNVFVELDYNVTDYGLLTVQFGEGAVVSPVWGVTASPFGDFYPTLDTQHILRIYYQGRF